MRVRQARSCAEERDVQRTVLSGTLPAPAGDAGVIIIEALAQAAGILAFKTVEVVPDNDTRFYFVAIDNARFRKPVEPGDQLMLKVTLKRAFKGIWKFHGLGRGRRRRSGVGGNHGGARDQGARSRRPRERPG